MAIYLNGVKVAGRGISGKSPYQIAASEGYTGTEAEFNAQLAAIGEAVAGFDELSRQVDEAKTEIEAAVDAADAAVTQALADISTAQTQINNTVNNATTTINNKVVEAEAQIDAKVEEALAQIPDSENLATKSYVSEQISIATASIVTDIFSAGTTAPSNNKLLWIDTNTSTGGLKYYNGSSWVHVPVAWG